MFVLRGAIAARSCARRHVWQLTPECIAQQAREPDQSNGRDRGQREQKKQALFSAMHIEIGKWARRQGLGQPGDEARDLGLWAGSRDRRAGRAWAGAQGLGRAPSSGRGPSLGRAPGDGPRGLGRGPGGRRTRVLCLSLMASRESRRVGSKLGSLRTEILRARMARALGPAGPGPRPGRRGPGSAPCRGQGQGPATGPGAGAGLQGVQVGQLGRVLRLLCLHAEVQETGPSRTPEVHAFSKLLHFRMLLAHEAK